MKVHVFGNSPSPAVAIYCMKRAALQGEKEHGSEPKQYVVSNFYVDDGLTSVATTEEAITILRKTQAMLAECNMKLHKIVSNSKTVMEAFPMDRAKYIKDLDLGVDPLPFQRSLRLSWNLETDSFSFQVSHNEKPFMRRGILSIVNSLYDPLGFVAPITMQGKALNQRTVF
jgi:limonene-1,2-epoxide hydrolase